MNKRKLVFAAVAEYAQTLGIPAPEVLIVGVDPEAKNLIGRRYLGCAYRGGNRIVVRAYGRTAAEIKSTVAHELVHLAFPKLDHGVNFEYYRAHLQSGFMAFDGRGLIKEMTKPKPTLSEEALKLLQRQKAIDTRIKRLTTAKKKILRRLNFLKKKGTS